MAFGKDRTGLRAFSRKGYTDRMAGHIFVRDPENPHTFWANPLAGRFALLIVSDMNLVNYEGMPIGGNMKRPANAAGFFIHAALRKALPDIFTTCHTHSIQGMAWTAIGGPFEMLTQDATYLNGDAQADFGSVVWTEEGGDRIGAALGPQGKARNLQNHGLLTVGNTIDEACFLMTLLEGVCQVQLLAEAAAANGAKKLLAPGASAKFTFENSKLERPRDIVLERIA